MKTIVDRFEDIKAYYKLSGRDLADKLGMPFTSVNEYISGRTAPSFKFLERILNTYPYISAEWLLRGKGKMHSINVEEYENEVKSLKMELTMKECIIKELRSLILEKNSAKEKQLVG